MVSGAGLLATAETTIDRDRSGRSAMDSMRAHRRRDARIRANGHSGRRVTRHRVVPGTSGPPTAVIGVTSDGMTTGAASGRDRQAVHRDVGATSATTTEVAGRGGRIDPIAVDRGRASNVATGVMDLPAVDSDVVRTRELVDLDEDHDQARAVQ